MGNSLARRTSVGHALQRDGPRIRTENGWYIDATGGQHALLYSRLCDRLVGLPQLDALDVIGVSRFLENERVDALAEWIAGYDDTPGLQSYFVSGGTEAFEIALAIAHHIHADAGHLERGAVLGLSGSYHGCSIAALNAGDHPIHRSRLRQAADLSWPTLVRAQMASPDETTRSLACIFESRSVAAMVVEPIGGTTAGALAIEEPIFGAIRDTCRRHGVLLITDEVVTGFGRTGQPFCASGNDFDIRMSGKLLGGGIVPICAVSVSPRVAALLDECVAAPPLRLTYAGNALAAKFALALQKLRTVGEPLDVQAKGEFLRAALEDRVTKFGAMVRGRGLLLAVVLNTIHAARFLQHTIEIGISSGVLLMGGVSTEPESMHLMVTPALDATEEDLEITADGVARVLSRAIGEREWISQS